MKFLLAFAAFASSCIFATTMARGYGGYNVGGIDLRPEANAPVNAAPVGVLLSQRLLPGGASYGAPAVGYGAPAVGYGAPAVGYGAPAVGYGASYAQDPQAQSLVRLALSLPTPAPDASINGKGYGYGSRLAPAALRYSTY